MQGGGESDPAADSIATAERNKEREEFQDRIIDKALRLLFAENKDDLLTMICDIVIQNFPVRSMLLLMRNEKSGICEPHRIIGYPEERIPIIKQKVIYTDEEIKRSLDDSEPVGKFSRRYLAENYQDIDDRDMAETRFPEKINSKRERVDSWHPLDRESFHFIDRTGKEIGYIYITSTTDDRQLDQKLIEGLDILSSIASVAIELVKLGEEERTQLEKQEKRTVQTSQILTVTSAVLTLADPSKLIHKVLELLEELFGFKSSSIILYDEAEKCYRWTAFRGYSDAQVARGTAMRMPKDIIDRSSGPEYRIGYIAHLRPAEKATAEDLQYFFTFGSVEEEKAALAKPRESPDSWHELDDMFFTIQDRTGETIGALCVDKPNDGRIPTRETVEMIEIFVSLVAIALENASLYSDANRSRDEVHVLNRLMFHDLMNYSMAIRGYLDLATAQPDDAGIERYIDRAMKQIDVTAKLVERVRKLSAIRSADKKNMLRIDLTRTIMNQASKTTGIFPSKKVQFTFDFKTEDAFVMANDLLPDLFHNIFMNAIRIDPHDTVMIEVGLKGETERQDESEKRSWIVSISDHGPGIPDERKLSIFLGVQKFMSAEPARGMGLGLSIVKSLLDLYGGDVWVEDREPGYHEKGAVFFVRLPAA
jgi:two-component system, OmpR family, sensor kinase